MSQRQRAAGEIKTVNSLGSLAELDLTHETVDHVLERAARLGLQVLEGWEAAAGSVVERGKVVSYGVTDERIHEVDQGQYDSGVGPCLDSLRTGVVQYYDGRDVEARWQTFAETAARHGIHSVLSVPLRYEDETLGALNFYSPKIDALQPGQREEGFACAAQVSVTITNARAFADLKQQVAQLEEGLATRTIIGQATGLLMAQEGLTSEEAFQRLVKISQTANVKLREIAQRYVEVWEERARGSEG
jgi:GAF domain-containing protein